jgi:hypothetical protein
VVSRTATAMHMPNKLKGTEDKKHARHVPAATAKNKELFVKALAEGKAPGDAATQINIARSTAYMWRSDDPDFRADWDNAVQTALDALECVLYERAKTLNSEDAWRILRYRRPEVYGGKSADEKPQSDFIVNITLEEQYKRLERLGLPIPVIESDYEEVVADDDAGEDKDKS